MYKRKIRNIQIIGQENFWHLRSITRYKEIILFRNPTNKWVNGGGGQLFHWVILSIQSRVFALSGITPGRCAEQTE